MERLIIFPRKASKPKKGDSQVREVVLSAVPIIDESFQGDDLTAETARTQLPLVDPYVREAPRKITDEEREFKAYRTLRDNRASARHEGKRKARQQKVRPFLTVCSGSDCPCRKKRKRLPRKSRPLTVFLDLLCMHDPCISFSKILPFIHCCDFEPCLFCHLASTSSSHYLFANVKPLRINRYLSCLNQNSKWKKRT